MKSFFNHTLLILTVILICSLAIIFRSQLLTGYERTQISIPTERVPAQTVPVPASIRSQKIETAPQKSFVIPKPKKYKVKKSWQAGNLSDFADAPPKIQQRIKDNIKRTAGSPETKAQ